MSRISTFFLTAIVFASFATSATAQPINSIVVFEDGFDRAGAGEDAKAVGNDWKLNTKEDHQFVVSDGAVHVTRNSEAKHSANMLHTAKFQNGTLAMRFKLVNSDDAFNVQVRDSTVTAVKQGMLFNVRFMDGKVELQDAVVAYHIKKAMQAKKTTNPSPEQQAELDKATVTVPMKLSVDQWHALLIHVQDKKLTVSVDGKKTASLSSDAIGHPRKDNFRVEMKRALVIDDIKVSKTATTTGK